MNAPVGSTRRAHGRVHAPARMLGIALTLFLLLSALTPILQQVSAADDTVDPTQVDQSGLQVDSGAQIAATDTSDGVVDDSQLADPPVAPTEVVDPQDPGDTVVDQTTVDQTLVDQVAQPDDGPSSIYINKFDCPSDFGHDIYQLAANCAKPTYDVEFQVYGPNLTQFYTGGVDQGNLETGVYQVREIIPSGYSEPVVFCKTSDLLGNDSGESEVVTYDGYYEFNLPAASDFYCDWFNVPTYPTDSYGTIYINKHDCPAGYDAYSEDIYGLASLCNQPLDGVDFSVSNSGGVIASGTTGDYSTGMVSFANVEVGNLTVSESLPDGYGLPIVYCKVTDASGTESAESLQTVSDDGSIGWSLSTGDVVFCDWFNVPSSDHTSIIVHKYNCPDGYYGQGSELSSYQVDCTEAAEGISFKLDGASTGNPGESLTDADGLVQWPNMEADQFYLTEEIPADFGTPVVFCTISNPQETLAANYDGYQVSDEGQIVFTLGEGQYIECYWFDIPTTHGSTINIHKYVCPDGIDVESSDLAAFQSGCTDPMAGISFKLDSASTGNPGNQETDDSGLVSWTGMEADEYYLTEEVPSGYGKPIVYCYIYSPFDEIPPVYQAYSLGDEGKVTFTLEEGQNIDCYWFNIPTSTSTITVYKYWCDESVHLDGNALNYYQDACPNPQENVTFGLDGDTSGDMGDQVTDAAGQVAWSGFDLDSWTLHEEIPAGYGDPIVFCSYSAFDNGVVVDGFPTRINDAVHGTTTWDDTFHNSNRTCWYFNIPNHDTSITIYKWACPEGFSLDSDVASDLCSGAQNGVTFVNDGPDGYHSQSDTGDSIDGAVFFGGLDAGTYNIQETLPAGYDYGFVLSCQGGAAPVPAIYPRYNTQWGGPLAIEIYEHETITCNWYNVPSYNPDHGTLTVIKYWCNGYVISALNCPLYNGGQKFRLTDASGGGEPTEFTTGADGTKTLVLPAGTWNLDEVGTQWCKAESADLNQYGEIVTSEGHDSVVKVYNCSDTKTPPAKHGPKQGPVTQFPNTGSGTMAGALHGTSADFGSTGLILLIVAQGLALLAIRQRQAIRSGIGTIRAKR